MSLLSSFFRTLSSSPSSCFQTKGSHRKDSILTELMELKLCRQFLRFDRRRGKHVIKGIMSRDEYFYEDPKISQYFFVWALVVFTIDGCLFVEKIKIKCLLACMKPLTNSENLSSNPFQEACSKFLVKSIRKLTVNLKIVFKSWLWKVLYTGEKQLSEKSVELISI